MAIRLPILLISFWSIQAFGSGGGATILSPGKNGGTSATFTLTTFRSFEFETNSLEETNLKLMHFGGGGGTTILSGGSSDGTPASFNAADGNGSVSNGTVNSPR